MTPEYQALSYQRLTQQYFQNAFLLHQQSHSKPLVSKPLLLIVSISLILAGKLSRTAKSVGYYIGLNVVGEVTLMDIGISKEHQGLGFGRDMLEHFLNRVSCKMVSKFG